MDILYTDLRERIDGLDPAVLEQRLAANGLTREVLEGTITQPDLMFLPNDGQEAYRTFFQAMGYQFDIEDTVFVRDSLDNIMADE